MLNNSIINKNKNNNMTEEAMSSSDIYYSKNKISIRTHRKIIRDQLKTDLFDIIGNICIRCGFTDRRALQLDHKSGGGNAECSYFKSRDNMYRYYRDNPVEAIKKLQTLCANCNWIKFHENQEQYINRVRVAQ